MAYPSPYRVGMSSLGFQTLYRILNEDGPGAHRAFLPDAWEPAALPWPAPRRPLLAYESQRPISDYPIVAVSVAYELEIAGLVRLLDGAGIPVLAADRGPRDSIVVCGGPLTDTNAAGLLPFCDLLVAGEAEERLPEIVRTILDARTRTEAIEASARLPNTCTGELAPGHEVELPPPARAPAALLPARAAITTPHAELSDMFLVEPERGCSRRCTFCVMRGDSAGGMRLFAATVALALVPEHARRVGLVGAAVTDHPELESLVAEIVATGRGVGVSSLRADRLTPALLRNLAAGGYRQITVASDGISERLRRRLDRKIDEQDLLRAAELVAAAGFRRLKVYEMIGAPGERDADVDELVRFGRELAKIVGLTLTFSTFVAKRNTPLDGAPFLGVAQAQARLRRIREGLAGRATLRPQSPKWALVEWEIARRGASAGHAVWGAVRAGGRFADYRRAFAELSDPPRAPCFGDEHARARRRGKAAERPRLPVVG